MQSVITHLETKLLKIKELLNTFMNYSDIIRWNFSTMIISGVPNYKWDKLDDAGHSLQETLLADYKQISQLIQFLISNLPTEKQRHLGTAIQIVINIIEQSGLLFSMNKEEQFHRAQKALELQIQALTMQYEPTDEYCFLLPDKSALIANPELELWKFEKINKSKVLLLPEISSELLKDIKDNAFKKIHAKISTCNEVNNVCHEVKISNHTMLQCLKLKSQEESFFPWLDVNNHVDKIIASYFEVLKINPHSQVLLITTDPALQKRADTLNVPYMKPPALKIAITHQETPKVTVEQNKPAQPPAKIESENKTNSKQERVRPSARPKTAMPSIPKPSPVINKNNSPNIPFNMLGNPPILNPKPKLPNKPNQIVIQPKKNPIKPNVQNPNKIKSR